MWYYNNVTRHIINIAIAIMWFIDKRTFAGRPVSGKITPEAVAWAEQQIKK